MDDGVWCCGVEDLLRKSNFLDSKKKIIEMG
jgi:hypothetical protein